MYKGGTGQWAYFLHRLSGAAIFLYLLIHIVDTALLGWGPKYFNYMMQLYTHPLFKLGEIGLFAAVLFHALNGLRICIFDFWVGATRYHSQIFWGAMVLFSVIFLPVFYIMIQRVHF